MRKYSKKIDFGLQNPRGTEVQKNYSWQFFWTKQDFQDALEYGTDWKKHKERTDWKFFWSNPLLIPIIILFVPLITAIAYMVAFGKTP